MSEIKEAGNWTPVERDHLKEWRTAPPPAQRVTFDPIPGEIIKAISQVQLHVAVVSKANKNEFGKYKYTSADDIYASLTNKLAEIGLVIIPIELSPVETKTVETQKGPKLWGRFHYGFVLAAGDSTWFDARNSRTLFIQLEGAQTFQAAESYLQKTYLRALFKIPTGDLDLDAIPKEEDVQAAKAKSKGKPKLDEKASRAKANELLKVIKNFDRPVDQKTQLEFVQEHGGDIETLLEEHKTEVRNAFSEALK